MGIFAWMKGRRERQEEAPPLPVPALGYQTGALQGIGSREDQEDAFAFVNDKDVVNIQREGLFAVVADGMGGMAGGQAASTGAISSLTESFASFRRQEDPPPQLEEALRLASSRVFSQLGGQGGSTAVACWLYREQLWFASVGDSGLYLLRDGQLNRLNQEHNVCGQVWRRTVLAGSMDPSAGREDPQASAVTSYLGMEELEEIDLLARPLALEPGDVLLVCSDGVDGTLDEQVLTACLSQDTPEYICMALRDEIVRQGKPYQDNYTALVIRCVA